jgi:O-acetyl-ADP-ribose deacetylase (regulator of RNase III)
LEDIDSGLESLVEEIKGKEIQSIAVPPLGCGLGGLSWKVVRPRIMQALGQLPNVRVLLFEPSGAPKPERMPKQGRVQKMTVGRAVLIELMVRYLAAIMDPFVLLFEIHKLMYFMQEAGENLNLKYEKALYGPYAKNLRHVLNVMEGHFIAGYADAADEPSKPIELLPDAPKMASALIVSHAETHARFERAGKLIHGFETPYGMELLATVHWVSAREGATSAEEAIERTYQWNERKRTFDKKQISKAWQVLKEQGWLA